MLNSETMWQFETAQFLIEWRISPTDDLDLSWDESGEVTEKLVDGIYTAFDSEMRITHKETGIELASDFLGGSIYENPRDFRDHFGCRKNGYGSYFSDMVRSAISEARKNLAKLQQ